uniref:kinesin-like protein KIN-14C isoform X2 n=1 Tax=Erigeron canadensis TaxID=72917 RepID=UPI001CB89939|nr:kinesin-like protein KIN-14C isoform X2 [Erigeron canadensis]
MAYQNKPPIPRSSSNKYRVVDEVSLDKHVKFGASMSPGRLPLTTITNEINVSESETVFTREGVDALLNERFRGGKYDSKGKLDWMTDCLKRLKVCIKWFRKGFDELVVEKDNLCEMLDTSERKRVEGETFMKTKEEEFIAAISKLEMDISSLKINLAHEKSEKLSEKEARICSEKNQELLRDELIKAKQEALNTSDKVKALDDLCKRLQEYVSSLQQYNTKLQKELLETIGAKKQAENEKAVILEDLRTLRNHHNFFQRELVTAEVPSKIKTKV